MTHLQRLRFMRVLRVKRYSKGAVALRSLSVLLILAAVSFTVAVVWHGAQNTIPAEGAAAPGPETDAAGAGGGSSLPEGRVEASAPEEASAGDAPEPETPEREPSKPAPAPGAVPETDRVDNSYFSDAIFFGDSLSTGIPLYQVAGNPDTVAYTGIDPVGINTNAVIVTPEGMKTVLEAAEQYGEKKRVYIMLGANALWMDEESFIGGYRDFIGNVKAQYPDAVIYIQSILPVTDDAYLTYSTADNEVISRFNKRLLELAKSTGVYYLDIAQALMDETGALPKEASPLDGMHLTPEYYEKWFDYLKTHVVEEKSK